MTLTSNEQPPPPPIAYHYDDYTIGWLTVLSEEAIAARLMFDEPHPRLASKPQDDNVYTLGRIGNHNVVIARPPRAGTDPATHSATNMARTFKNLRFLLLVGTGGGAPKKPVSEDSGQDDLRLGDVVVSYDENGTGGVLQYDYGKFMSGENFNIRPYFKRPPVALLNAVRALQEDHSMGEAFIEEYIQDALRKTQENGQKKRALREYKFPGWDRDVLYQPTDETAGENTEGELQTLTSDADTSPRAVTRVSRDSYVPVVHYGLIATANAVMGSAKKRDELRDKYGVACFEMEAAGLMDTLPCVVIRGISDYSDEHKNDGWKHWASLTAAACAKDLLRIIQPVEIQDTKAVIEIIQSSMQGRNEAADNTRRWEETQRKLNKIKDELCFPYELSKMLKNENLKKRHEGTCEWLKKDPQFNQWKAEDPENPILWVHGKHGVGKSVLCATAIDEVKSLHGDLSVIYAFMLKSHPISPNELLRHLADQLLNAISDDSSEFPSYLEEYLNIEKYNSSAIMSMIHKVLSNRPQTFLFIDGLDEPEYFDFTSKPLAQRLVDERMTKEMGNVVCFLLGQANSSGGSTKLWITSQRTVTINDYFDTFKIHSCLAHQSLVNIQEIEVNGSKTSEDVEAYLSSAIPESVKGTNAEVFVEFFADLALLGDDDSTFLWASSVYQDLERIEDEASILEVLGSVPRKVEQQYTAIMERIKQKALEVSFRQNDLPIWKIALSMVVFAKRPLRISELIDGVAVLRTQPSDDIQPENRPKPKVVLDACMSFLTVLSTEDDDDCAGDEEMAGYTVILSHGTIRKFLIEGPGGSIRRDGPEELVSSTIIGDCCLRFLSQPKFKNLLEKAGNGGLFTGETPRKYITANSLLFYAAKYWHHHFDTEMTALHAFGPTTAMDPTEEDLEAVIKFLESPNFVTCVQVQSLCVEGHFMQSYDSITDQTTNRKRVLPNWMLRCGKGLYCQYEDFMSEWGELLRSGLSEHVNGELDRYRKDSWKRICEDTHKIIHIKFSRKDTNFDSYGLPYLKNFPLIPSLRCIAPPDAIAVFHKEMLIRIGSNFFKISEAEGGGADYKAVRTENGAFADSWEDICFRGKYLVASRRRIPAHEHSKPASSCSSSAYGDSDEEDAGGDASSSSGDDSWVDDSAASASVASDNTFDSDSQGGYASEDNNSEISVEDAPSESGSEGSDFSNAKSDSDSGSEDSDAENEEMGLGHNIADLDELESDFNSDCASNGSRCSTRSNAAKDSQNQSEQTSRNWSFNAKVPKQAEALAAMAENRQRITIAEDRERYPCKVPGCTKQATKRWYYCPICSPQSSPYNVCNECERRGRWCLDKTHHLYEMFENRAIGVIARNKFVPKQDIDVYDTSDTDMKLLFTYRGKYRAMLHESPPAIHPQSPLVVWALNGSELLFADIDKNSWKRRKIEHTPVGGKRPLQRLPY
ncbi:hypothetical protein ABW19_dt0201895 [Dactylella cylindrospora]|nr:hypothetical protein ABW19_dt0201895 [Dactylella cylindrospora]